MSGRGQDPRAPGAEIPTFVEPGAGPASGAPVPGPLPADHTGAPDAAPPRRRGRRPFPGGQVLVATATVALAGLTFADVFGPDPVVVPVVVAAGVPALVATTTRMASRRRPHLAPVVALQLLAYVVAAAALIVPASAAGRVLPTAATFAALGDAVDHGWRSILATHPAPDRPEALLVPFTLTFLAALVTAELVARTRRVLLVPLPGLLLSVAGLAFAAGGAGESGYAGSWGPVPVLAAAMLSVGLVALRGSAFAADRRPFDGRSPVGVADGDAAEAQRREQVSGLRRQRLAVGVPFVVVVTVVAVGLGRLVPFAGSDRPERLRYYVTNPLDQDRDLNPLTQIAGDRADDRVRYRLRLDGPAPHDLRVRLVALDRYDGVQWTSGSEHVSTGSRLPRAPEPSDAAPGGAAREVGYEVEMVDPVGPWLPTLDRPARVAAPSEVDVRVDPVTGALIVPGSPPRGDRYGIVSNVADVDPAAVAGAGVATDDAARASVADHDDLPPELAELRNKVTDRASSPFMQLAVLQLFLDNDPRFNEGTRFTVDPEAPAGFTVGHIGRFLGIKAARAGRPEQFAAAFATLARSLGLPTRVVVGFVPPAPVNGQTVDLHARDLTAWPEVAFAGIGWVPFDVVPDERTDRTVTVNEQDLQSQVAEAGDQAAIQEEDQAGRNPNLDPVPPAVPDEGGVSRVHVALALAAGALLGALAYVLSPAVRKRRRRKARRRAPDVAGRIEGAWREALDRLVEAGEEHVTARTTRQAAAAAATHAGGEAGAAMTELGHLHDAALHAPTEPPVDWGERAWHLTGDIGRLARLARTRRQRLRAALDRRPLAATALGPDHLATEPPPRRPSRPASPPDPGAGAVGSALAARSVLPARSPGDPPLVPAGGRCPPGGGS